MRGSKVKAIPWSKGRRCTFGSTGWSSLRREESSLDQRAVAQVGARRAVDAFRCARHSATSPAQTPKGAAPM